jgi:hypothetical protein
MVREADAHDGLRRALSPACRLHSTLSSPAFSPHASNSRNLASESQPVTQKYSAFYDYADNFVMRSLDGITDSRLLRYICNEWIDHDGYLIDAIFDRFPQLY